MNEYDRGSFVLGNTLHEFFKLDSTKILKAIHTISDNGGKYEMANSESACIFKIDNIDYMAVSYNLGKELHLMVSQVDKIEENDILQIKRVCCLDVELDFRHQIQFYIDGLTADKKYDKAKETKSLYDEYDSAKKREEIHFENSVKYINSFLYYDLELVSKILKSLNIESDSILSVMKNELLLKSNLMKNDLIEIFNNIPDFFEFDEKYYYGDADFSLVRLPSTDGSILLGYNNVVSCDEYFLLLSKNNDDYSVRFESFKNLEKIEGYKDIDTLNAFENDKNTTLVKKLEPVYQSNREDIIKTSSFSTFAFAINSINYCLTNEEPC